MMDDIKIKLLPYQDKFLFSEARAVAMVSGIATGKTRWGLYKLWQFCQAFPNSLALLLRKQQTDAFGSTMKDFKTYFGVEFDSSNQFVFPNGSMIIAKHAGETSALTNYNLNFILVEQGEELDEDTFHFLRDRLRRETSPYQQLVILANANGQNYIKKLFIDGAEKVNVLDAATGQVEYFKENFHCLTANTWANKENLPAAYIKDLESMRKTAPRHFAVYVENSFEVESADDLVFPMSELKASMSIDYSLKPGFGFRILACDPARFGDDATSCVIIQQMGTLHWELIALEEWQGKDAVYTVGRVNEISIKHNVDKVIIDEDGLGGPVSDFFRANSQQDVVGFRNVPYSSDKSQSYGNSRTEAAFKVKELINKGWLKITDPKVIQELNTAFMFKFTTRGQRILVSKEELRKQGIASPNAGDALCYACSLVDDVRQDQARKYAPRHQTEAPDTWNPFAPTPPDDQQFPRSHRSAWQPRLG